MNTPTLRAAARLGLAALALTAPAFAPSPAFMLSPASAQTAPSPLPIKDVTVFTSGVSAIERGGDVTGDATVPLTFRTAQINDILKSLTLMDTNGTVQPVVYGARDPIGRTLQSFAVDVTSPQSRADLLNHLRGSSVTVTTAAKATYTGQIVSVESKSILSANNTATTVDTLNLLGADGLLSVRLDDVAGIKLLDARLDKEFREALTTLASGADDQRRSVTLHFAGSGKRAVSVGYITESPLWKISYRLLLSTPQKSYIQGWALVENTSDEDWSGIHLSLVSGRPISFIQDLYQPLYLPRPVVQPDIVASPTPQTHGDNMQADSPLSTTASASEPAPMAPAMPSAALPDRVARIYALQSNNSLLVQGKPSDSYQSSVQPFGKSGVTAQAKGADAGEQFAYNITTPVTLPRQQAAMIPVIAQDISAEKVSLYNADSDPRFPLNAVRLKNNTTLHLKGGPVTLFDSGTYAGDATMEDVPPGDTRIISYAVDLSVVGERQDLGTNQTRTTLQIHQGVLTVTVRTRSETKYIFKSKAPADKTVLVEHPFDAAATLVKPATATERTADLYRFAVPVAAGKAATLDVVTEKPVYSTVALLSDDINSFAVYAEQADIPTATRTALTDIARQRRHIQNLTDQAANAESQVAQIGVEQDRLRKNMGALDHASALYKRYVGELDTQETQITALRAEAKRLRDSADSARSALRDTLGTLEIGG